MGKAVMIPGVFISHSRHDNEIARDIARRLRAAGFEAFVDSEDLTAGADWAAEIRKQLRKTRVFLPLVTPASLASSWSMRELGMAEALGQTVMPVTVGVSQEDLPDPMKSYRAIPFDQLDDAIQTLSEDHSSSGGRRPTP